MLLALQVVTLLSTGIFAGAALYVSLVGHPARTQCGVETATTKFHPNYRRAVALQAPMAAMGCVGAMLLCGDRESWLWLPVAVALGSVIPLTLLMIVPTNNKLLDPSLDRRSDKAEKLLVRWSWMHGIRTALGIGSFIVVLVSLGTKLISIIANKA